MDELHFTIHSDELFPSVNMDELYSTIYIDELFPLVNMDELHSTVHSDELIPQFTWTSSTLLFILTSSSLSSHGRALLYYSFIDKLFPSVNMDELYSTIHSLTSSSHQSTWTSFTQLFILTSSSLSSHGRALLYYSFIDELFPSVNMDELLLNYSF